MLTKLIYILDDSKVSRNLLELKLNKFVFKAEIVSFECAEDMMKSYKLRKPDVLVIDYYLRNNLTSPSVIRSLRLLDQELLIINISSDENPEVSMEALRAGANNCTYKRDFDRIVSMIRNHLRIRAKIGTSNIMNNMLSIYRQKRLEKLTTKDTTTLNKLMRDAFVQEPIDQLEPMIGVV